MKLYEQFARKDFHTSIATTFGLDFDAYENIVLPRLRGAGCRNNIVIADSRMLTFALSGDAALPKHAGQLYTVNGYRAGGVFHPKLFLQFGRRAGRLIVSSANLTASGLAGNLELVGHVSSDNTETGEQRLIRQAWDYASRLIDGGQQAPSGQIDWMLARTPWLESAEPANAPVVLADGTLAALLTTGEPTGIGTRFAALIDEPVSRLIVISPYWDMELAALSMLAERLEPAEISVLVDPACKNFPKAALGRLPTVRLYGCAEFSKGRFIHAKAVIAQTPSADHVLMGSANCTRAALGTDGFAGGNEEVCLYRRLPPQTVPASLGIIETLDDGQRIDPASLNAPDFEDDIPLGDLARKTPGQFECRVDTLTWYPAAGENNPLECDFELFNQHGESLPCTLDLLHDGEGRALRYQISDMAEQPAFARVRFADSSVSALAVVALVDRIRAVIRETRSRRVENALRELDSETEASLALLDVLDVLENLERNDASVKDSRSVARKLKSRTDAPTENQYQVLSYSDFIAGRRPRSDGKHVMANSLAESDVSMVRGFLNRILGKPGEDEDAQEHDKDEALKRAFDLGDETDNAEAAVAAGEEFNTGQDKAQDDETVELERRKQAARKATKAQIVKAASAFIERIRTRREAGQLDNYDVLRLRALLMIICAAALPGESSGGGSRLQVLPLEKDDQSWPNIIGRLIFSLFGGNNPAFKDLRLRSDHDQIPDDFIECWATCYWCLQACLTAALSATERQRLDRLLLPLLKKVCLFTLPTEQELLGSEVLTIMEGMSTLHAQRLGIPPEKIEEGHRNFVNSLFAEKGRLAG